MGTDVISLSCRFPESPAAGPVLRSTCSFWNQMMASANLPQPVPLQRWCPDTFFAVGPAQGRAYARFAAFVPSVTAFDSNLFQMASAEAVALDPQTRVLMEEVFVALRATGDSSVRAESEVNVVGTGLYVGCMYQEYPDVLMLGGATLTPASVTGNSLSFMVGRCDKKKS